MVMRKMFCAALLAAGVAVSPAKAQTWDGIVSGKVTHLHTAHGNNLDFRVYLDGSPACGSGTPGFAYINHDYDNYQVTAALIMTAWTTSRSITLYTTKDANGWCRIGYVAVAN